MALPHLPATYTARKGAYESAISKRREKEDSEHARWADAVRYYHDTGIQCSKQGDWTSEANFEESMDAYRAEIRNEKRKSNLERRRRRLAEMLEKERIEHRNQLSGYSLENGLRLQDAAERVVELKSARESRRQEVANDLLYQQFLRNNPDLRELERDQHRSDVVSSWADQREEQLVAAETSRRAQRAWEEEEKTRLTQMRDAEKRELKRRNEEEREVARNLRQQMEKLRERELEAEHLKTEESLLIQQRVELEEEERRRREREQRAKSEEHGRQLLRQHTASLKRRSRQVQEDLEEDLNFLAALAQQDKLEAEKKGARREEARSDAAWMQQVLDEQLRLEKAREAELDVLFKDEAARLWSKREAEWQREAAARERLISEVLAARAEQLAQKMEMNQRAQMESLVEREKLLYDVERQAHLTQREEEARNAMERAQAAELQMQAQQQHVDRLRRAEAAAIDEGEERAAEEAYLELLRHEAERLRMRGYEPPSSRRAASGARQAWQ